MLDEKEKGCRLEDGSPKNIENQHTENITDISTKANADSTLEPDFDMAARFLSMLDPNAKSFTFQVFHDKNKKHRPEVIPGALDEVWERLAAYNKIDYGIFVTVNETDGAGRKKENIVRVRALWRELDKKPFGEKPSISQSIEVESSPGNQHNYFLCDDLSFDDFKGCQRRLVESHGSDPNAALLNQVLRLPGFFHCKGEPFMVRLLGGTGRGYSRDEILAAFPPIYRDENRAAIEGDMPYSPAAESLLRSWIKFIPGQRAVERHDWISQGIMFARLGDDWGEAPGRDDIRLELWETLSRKCEGYENDTECAEKWDDILQSASRPCDNPATFRSLLHAARGAAWTWESSGIDPALIDDARAALNEALGRPSPEDCFEIELLDHDRRLKGDGGGGNGEQAGAPATRVICRRASDIAPEPIFWVWKGWLARGMYHILGAPRKRAKQQSQCRLRQSNRRAENGRTKRTQKPETS